MSIKGFITEPFKNVGKDILSAYRRKQKTRNDQGNVMRNTDRLNAIKSAIKEKDYVYNPGDEKIYPGSIKYKGQ